MYSKINVSKCPVALRPWMAHLDEYWSKHPTMSMKQAMKGAKATYKKKAGAAAKPKRRKR
jgi:hypothetical protein